MKEKLCDFLGLYDDTGIQQAAYDKGSPPPEDTPSHADRPRVNTQDEQIPPPPSFAKYVTSPSDITATDYVTVCRHCALIWITRSVSDADELVRIHHEEEGHAPAVMVAATVLFDRQAWTTSCSECHLQWISLHESPHAFVADHALHTNHPIEQPKLVSIDALPDTLYKPAADVRTSIRQIQGIGPYPPFENDEADSDDVPPELERWSQQDSELSIPTLSSIFGRDALDDRFQ